MNFWQYIGIILVGMLAGVVVIALIGATILNVFVKRHRRRNENNHNNPE